MRKRIPRYENGGTYMSDVDKKILPKAQLGTSFQQSDLPLPTPYRRDRSSNVTMDELSQALRLAAGQASTDASSNRRAATLLRDLQRENMMMGIRKRGGSTQKRKGKNWIKGAIKKPGALRATAKRAGAMKKDGTIKKSWLQQQAKKGNSKTAQRARLALTLSKMKKR
tara:strand:- start:745 stop:1248 length:504 start_codon:yes stop_codon:yes gene_type:complete